MSARFSEEALKEGNGLGCIYYKSDPDRYQRQQRCHPGNGWQKVGGLCEHIWRCHAPVTHCDYCGTRWPSLGRSKKLPEAREKHIPDCRILHGNKKRQVQHREPEIMSEEQQGKLRGVKKCKDVERKLEALYTACDLPLPETYHVRPLGPQIVEGQFSEPALPEHDALQSQNLEVSLPTHTNTGRTIFDGFQMPVDPSLPFSHVPFSDHIDRAEAGSSYLRPVDQHDSGYSGSETQDKKQVLLDSNNRPPSRDPFSQGDKEVQYMAAWSPWLCETEGEQGWDLSNIDIPDEIGLDE